jgi:hypothetical protein
MSERLHEIANRLSAATPAPWEVRDMHSTFHSAVVFHGRHEKNQTIIQWLNGYNRPADLALVVNAPADLADLVRVAKAAKDVCSQVAEFGQVVDSETMDALFNALAALDTPVANKDRP